MERMFRNIGMLVQQRASPIRTLTFGLSLPPKADNFRTMHPMVYYSIRDGIILWYEGWYNMESVVYYGMRDGILWNQWYNMESVV